MCDRKQFLTGLRSLTIRLTPDSVDRLLIYCRELRKWNRQINLIARNTSDTEIVEKHFLDSLALLPLIIRHSGPRASLLDIGTGAGFPGLVLAAAMPELQVTLMEPRQKRAVFLRHIIRTLVLTNVRVQELRLEPGPAPSGSENRFTFITSRALAAPAVFLPMVEHLADRDTLVILMQAAGRQQEDVAQSQHWRIVDVYQVALPFSGHPRLLSLMQKQRHPG